MTSSGWPITSTRPNGQPRSSARSNPIWRRRAERSSKNSAPGATNMATIERTPTGLIKLNAMRPDEVGTDPTAALRIACPIPDIGALAVPPKSYSVEDSQLLKDCAGVKAGEAFSGNPFAKTVQVAVDSIKQKAYAAAGIDTARAARYGGSRPTRRRRLARHAHRYASRPMVLMQHDHCMGSGQRRPTCTTDRSRRCTTCCFPRISGPRRLRLARGTMTR